MSFSRRVKSHLALRGEGIYEFAGRLGVTYITLWKWLKCPTTKQIEKIAKALDVTVDELEG